MEFIPITSKFIRCLDIHRYWVCSSTQGNTLMYKNRNKWRAGEANNPAWGSWRSQTGLLGQVQPCPGTALALPGQSQHSERRGISRNVARGRGLGWPRHCRIHWLHLPQVRGSYKGTQPWGQTRRVGKERNKKVQSSKTVAFLFRQDLR